MEINQIICGDTLEELKKLPTGNVDCVITSPPYYGLRNYSVDGQIGLEENFDEFLKRILEITAELKRVLKPTGQFWLNMGDCYGGSNGMGSDQSNPGKQTAPRPKRLKSFGGNIKSSGLSNPESLLNKGRSGKDKCMLMQPERIAIKMIDEQGWILRNKIKWAKQVLIRKENRTIGGVMPTSVKDRFNESGEELYFFVKNKNYYFNLDAVRLRNQVMGVTDFRENQGGFVNIVKLYPENSKYNNLNYRPFNRRVRDVVSGRMVGQPQFKASKKEIENYPKYAKGSGFEQKYGEPWDRFGKKTFKAGKVKWDISERQAELVEGGVISSAQRIRGFYDEFGGKNNPDGKNLPTIWQIGSEPHNFQKELDVDTDHFAIFPEALIEIPILAGCPKDGVVLDPFMGSGTTAVVAKKLKRNWLGIEINPNYIKIANQRIRSTPTPLL